MHVNVYATCCYLPFIKTLLTYLTYLLTYSLNMPRMMSSVDITLKCTLIT